MSGKSSVYHVSSVYRLVQLLAERAEMPDMVKMVMSHKYCRKRILVSDDIVAQQQPLCKRRRSGNRCCRQGEHCCFGCINVEVR